jgi:hypothetical protein
MEKEMNQEQIKSAVRWLIASFGPVIIQHGYASTGTLEMIGGVAVSLAPLIWGMITHTQTNAVAVVDTIAKQPDSPVKAVIAEDTPAGHDMAAALPGNTTVVAGSSAASNLAKAA